MGTLTPGLPNCTKFNRRFESGTASPAQAASLPYSEKTRSLEIATFRRHTYLHPAAEAIKRWGKLPYCKDGYKAQRDKRTRSILRHVPDDLKIGGRKGERRKRRCGREIHINSTSWEARGGCEERAHVANGR